MRALPADARWLRAEKIKIHKRLLDRELIESQGSSLDSIANVDPAIRGLPAPVGNQFSESF
jgi:hypothetical protein